MKNKEVIAEADEASAWLDQVKEFKQSGTRAERRQRLKKVIADYEKHMATIKSVKPIDPTDDSEEGIKKIEALENWVERHRTHTGNLRDYIIAFMPKTNDPELLSYGNGKVYYDGKKL